MVELTWWVKEDGGPRKATRRFCADASAIASNVRLVSFVPLAHSTICLAALDDGEEDCTIRRHNSRRGGEQISFKCHSNSISSFHPCRPLTEYTKSWVEFLA